MSMGDAGARDVARCSEFGLRFRAIFYFAEGVLSTKHGKPTPHTGHAYKRKGKGRKNEGKITLGLGFDPDPHCLLLKFCKALSLEISRLCQPGAERRWLAC